MPEVTQLVNGTAWIRLTSSDDKAKDLFSTLLFLPMSFTNPYLGILKETEAVNEDGPFQWTR